MDDYYSFCTRNAQRLAALAELEEAEPTAPSRQRSSEGLVYKTFSPAPQPQQSATMGMDPQTQDEWNRWRDVGIANAFRELAPHINKALDDMADETNKALAETNQALADLRKALDFEREQNIKLRSEVEVMRIVTRAQNIGAVMRGRNVS
jgi:hypothetical protein